MGAVKTRTKGVIAMCWYLVNLIGLYCGKMYEKNAVCMNNKYRLLLFIYLFFFIFYFFLCSEEHFIVEYSI